MRFSRFLPLFVLATGVLVNGAPRAQDPVGPGSPAAENLEVTRVFYLQGMSPLEAMTLLRWQLTVHKVARIPGRDVIVVCDDAGRVNRSEDLLRGRDAVSRATDPYGPLDLGRLREGPVAVRVFRIRDAKVGDVSSILRVVYGTSGVTEIADESAVSVSDAPVILDAAEALLRELGLLVEGSKGSGDS